MYCSHVWSAASPTTMTLLFKGYSFEKLPTHHQKLCTLFASPRCGRYLTLTDSVQLNFPLYCLDLLNQLEKLISSLSSFANIERPDLIGPWYQERPDWEIGCYQEFPCKCSSPELTFTFFFVTIRGTTLIWVYTYADFIYIKIMYMCKVRGITYIT